MREADPTAYSQLPPKEVIEIGRTDYGQYPIVTSGGETYIELPAGRKYGSIEQIASRLFKGIVNVADVVEGTDALKGRFFSKVMPLELIEKESEDEDIDSDIAVLSGIFVDPDRGFERMENGKYSAKNVMFNGKVATYYDFGGFRPNLFDPTPLRLDYAKYNSGVLEKMKQKLSQLHARISGDSGLVFLRAICKNIDFDSIPHPLDRDIVSLEEVVNRLQDSLQKKIQKMKEGIDIELLRHV